jgi:hypothetical protein
MDAGSPPKVRDAVRSLGLCKGIIQELFNFVGVNLLLEILALAEMIPLGANNTLLPENHRH